MLVWPPLGGGGRRRKLSKKGGSFGNPVPEVVKKGVFWFECVNVDNEYVGEYETFQLEEFKLISSFLNWGPQWEYVHASFPHFRGSRTGFFFWPFCWKWRMARHTMSQINICPYSFVDTWNYMSRSISQEMFSKSRQRGGCIRVRALSAFLFFLAKRGLSGGKESFFFYFAAMQLMLKLDNFLFFLMKLAAADPINWFRCNYNWAVWIVHISSIVTKNKAKFKK